jgi:hypothetical protein
VLLAATSLVYPVWAMVAMAVINSLWSRPALLFDAIHSVGHVAAFAREQRPSADYVAAA